MKTEREGLVKFFEREATRFYGSIPPIKAFESWVECIEEVRSLHEADVSVVVEKAQAKAADDMVVEKATAEGSNEPVVEQTELSEQTSNDSVPPPESQATTITISPPPKKRKDN